MASEFVAQVLNPYTGEWVTFPQPVLVGTDHLDCFVAQNQREFAKQWNTEHPDEPVEVPDGARACPTCAPHFAEPEPTDLHAAIRKRLDERPVLASFEAARAANVNAWAAGARDALLTVLDWHGTNKQGNCQECREGGSGYEAEPVEAPCPTVRAIAEKLGIAS